MADRAALIKQLEEDDKRRDLIAQLEAQDEASEGVGRGASGGKVSQATLRSAAEGYTLGASEPVISGIKGAFEAAKEAALRDDVDFSTDLVQEKYDEDVEARRKDKMNYPDATQTGEFIGAVLPGPGLVGKAVGLAGKAVKAIPGIGTAAKAIDAASKGTGVASSVARIAKAGAEGAANVGAFEGTKRAIETPTGFIQEQDNLPSLEEGMELGAGLSAGMQALPEVGNPLLKGGIKFGKKMLSILGGVPVKNQEKYIALVSNLDKAPNIDSAKEFITNLKDDLKNSIDTGQMNRREADMILRDAKTELDRKFQQMYEPIKNVKAPVRLSDEVLDAQMALKKKVGEESSKAFQILEKSGVTVPRDQVLKQIEQVQESLKVDGKLVSEKSKIAHARLEQLKKDLPDSTDITAPSAKRLLQEIDDDTDYNPAVGAFDDVKNAALKDIRRFIDGHLKSLSPGYKSQMEKLAPEVDLLSKAFRDLGTSEKAVRKLSNIDSLGNAPTMDVLKRLGSATGKNFSTPLDDYMSTIAKQTPEAQEAMRRGLPEYAAVQTAGADLNVIKQKLFDDQRKMNLVTKIFDPKANDVEPFLSKLSLLTDQEMVDTLRYVRTAAPFEKSFQQGSANVNYWALVMGGLGGLIIGEGSLPLAAGGAILGKYADKYGPRVTKDIIDATLAMKRSGAVTMGKIDRFMTKIPPEARQQLKDDLIKAIGAYQDEGLVEVPPEQRQTLYNDIKDSNLSNTEKAQMASSLNKDGVIKGSQLSKVMVSGYKREQRPQVLDLMGAPQ